MTEKKVFNFQEFINDSKEILVNPKGYFEKMPKSGGLGEPIIKAIIYAGVAGVFAMLWSLLIFPAFFGAATAASTAFISSLIVGIIGVFVGGLIILILSLICGGDDNFEANLRVAASLMVFMPISAFLNVISAVSLSLSMIVSLVVNLYALYVLYHGLVFALKGNEKPAKTIGLVLGGILLLFTLVGSCANKVADKRIEKWNRAMEQWQDEID